jgi:hypothetical protein
MMSKALYRHAAGRRALNSPSSDGVGARVYIDRYPLVGQDAE